MQQLNDEQLLRYSRHLLLDAMTEDAQLSILDGTVLIVGAGGLGCAVIPYLAAAGVGHLIIVDGDKVELSNLHRQVLHSQQDIGKAKVDSVGESVDLLSAGCELELHDHYFSAAHAELIDRATVVIDCSDNLETRNLLNQLCFETKTPLVSGAAIRFEGQVITLDMAKDSACYQCYSHLIGDQQLSCSQSGVFSPIVGVVGSLQATEALKLLAGLGKPSTNKLWLFDGLRMDFRSVNVAKYQDCKVCSL